MTHHNERVILPFMPAKLWREKKKKKKPSPEGAVEKALLEVVRHLSQ